MNRYKECVLDASMGAKDGLYCFCPIDGDIYGEFDVLTGMNFLSPTPPEAMKCVGVVHIDGQEAVEAFCKEHKEYLIQIGLIEAE